MYVLCLLNFDPKKYWSLLTGAYALSYPGRSLNQNSLPPVQEILHSNLDLKKYKAVHFLKRKSLIKNSTWKAIL